jgi:CBS domain-containing protein
MKFAFCLYKYFPFGGQQRDFLKIAKTCTKRGHHVDNGKVVGVFTDGDLRRQLEKNGKTILTYISHMGKLNFRIYTTDRQ